MIPDPLHTLFDRPELVVVGPFTTLLETYTLLLRRVTPRVAQDWLNEISAQTTLVNPLPGDYHNAIRLVQRYQDQPITLSDGILTNLSTRLSLSIWTFDHHFDLMHASVWR